MAFLRFNRECCDRTCFQATQRDGFAGFLAIAVSAVVDASERLIDLGDELALPVARAKLDGSVGLGRCPVCKIWMVLIFFLKVQQRFLGFLENIFPPGEQLRAKIFALALVHERLLVGWPIIFILGQHSLLPVFVLARSRSPSRGWLIYVRQSADNIGVRPPGRRDLYDSSMT